VALMARRSAPSAAFLVIIGIVAGAAPRAENGFPKELH
jgi:hypothetical protein